MIKLGQTIADMRVVDGMVEFFRRPATQADVDREERKRIRETKPKVFSPWGPSRSPEGY